MLTACAASDSAGLYDPDPSVQGELGNGEFFYDCDSSTRDCQGGHAPSFPTRIAVGARFSLQYRQKTNTSAAGNRVEPGAQTLLELRDDGWRAIAPGTVSVLVKDSLGELFDFTYVDLLTSSSVLFSVAEVETNSATTLSAVDWRPLDERTFRLADGERYLLLAEAVDSANQRLAGEPLLELRCDNPILRLIKPPVRPGRFTLVGEGPGEANCNLSALGFTLSFPVTIGDAPEPPLPDAGADPDASDGNASSDGGAQ